MEVIWLVQYEISPAMMVMKLKAIAKFVANRLGNGHHLAFAGYFLALAVLQTIIQILISN